MNRRLLLVLLLLVGLLLVLGVASVPPTSADPDPQTHCWCVQISPDWWCYRCCDAVNGCYNLYCDTECP